MKNQNEQIYLKYTKLLEKLTRIQDELTRYRVKFGNLPEQNTLISLTMKVKKKED